MSRVRRAFLWPNEKALGPKPERGSGAEVAIDLGLRALERLCGW